MLVLFFVGLNNDIGRIADSRPLSPWRARADRGGGVPIGGGAPRQRAVDDGHQDARRRRDAGEIARLREAGVDIVRVAVPGIPDADALPAIVAGAGVPIIADIHFNASLALRAMDAGVAAVRINPGNIGGEDRVEQVVRRAQQTGTPSGSAPTRARCPSTCAGRPRRTPPERS